MNYRILANIHLSDSCQYANRCVTSTPLWHISTNINIHLAHRERGIRRQRDQWEHEDRKFEAEQKGTKLRRTTRSTTQRGQVTMGPSKSKLSSHGDHHGSLRGGKLSTHGAQHGSLGGSKQSSPRPKARGGRKSLGGSSKSRLSSTAQKARGQKRSGRRNKKR